MYSHYPISPSPYGGGYTANPSAGMSLSMQQNGQPSAAPYPPHPHYAAYHHPVSPAPAYPSISKAPPMNYPLPTTPNPHSLTTQPSVPSDIQSGADALFQVANTRKRLRNESDDSASSGASGSSQSHSLSPQPTQVNSSAFRTRAATAAAYAHNGHTNGDYAAEYMDGSELNGDAYGNDYSLKVARRNQDGMAKYQMSNTLLPPSPRPMHPSMNVHMHMQMPRALTGAAAATSYVYAPNPSMNMSLQPVPMQQTSMHIISTQTPNGAVPHSHSPIPSSHSLSYSGSASQSVVSTPASSSASSSTSSSSSYNVNGSSTTSNDGASTPGAPSPNASRTSPTGGHSYRDDEKKRKHQETDRQRRQKIKDGMESLRLFVDHDASLKADQATIVGRSVELIREQNAEIATLRKKLRENEAAASANTADSADGRMNGGLESSNVSINVVSESNQISVLKKYAKSYQVYDSLLSATGVAFFRTCCSGRVIEANSTFEQISGFTAASLLGTIPCLAPLNMTLSIMPASITRLFSSVAESPNTSAPSTPASTASTATANDAEKAKNPPLFTINLSSLPAIPESELRPYVDNEKDLKHIVVGYGSGHEEALADSATSKSWTSEEGATISRGGSAFALSSTMSAASASSSSTAASSASPKASSSSTAAASASAAGVEPQQFAQLPCVHPKPNGAYLLAHLSKLPPASVMKLFCRHDTANGDIIEAVIGIQLVRTEEGRPGHMIVMSTPDSRRLIKRTPDMQSVPTC